MGLLRNCSRQPSAVSCQLSEKSEACLSVNDLVVVVHKQGNILFACLRLACGGNLG